MSHSTHSQPRAQWACYSSNTVIHILGSEVSRESHRGSLQRKSWVFIGIDVAYVLPEGKMNRWVRDSVEHYPWLTCYSENSEFPKSDHETNPLSNSGNISQLWLLHFRQFPKTASISVNRSKYKYSNLIYFNKYNDIFISSFVNWTKWENFSISGWLSLFQSLHLYEVDLTSKFDNWSQCESSLWFMVSWQMAGPPWTWFCQSAIALYTVFPCICALLNKSLNILRGGSRLLPSIVYMCTVGFSHTALKCA